MSSDRNYEYEVALSFAGEDRPYASQLANILRRRGVRFFFDEYEKYTLWGKNLKWAVTLTQQYDIKNWYAIGATEVGQSMLERLGFKEMVSLEEGARKGYLLKDVHHPSKLLNKFLTEMEEEEVDLSTHHTTAKFVKATEEDIPEAVALAAEVFGGLNTIPVEKRTAWLRKNPDIDYLLKQGDQLVGYLTFVPLRPETIEDLLTLKRYAKDLTADDILTYEPQQPVDIYGMAIGVKPGVSLSQKRLYGERLILGAKSVLLDLAKRGIIICRIIAHSFMPDGIRLMKHIGFTETPPKAPGLRDFMIDIESSGIPFLREYKEVLKNSLPLEAR